MKVERFVNSIFNSNSYLLTNGPNEPVWVVDPGDSQQLIEAIGNKTLKGILLTHTHFDHIYGVSDLILAYPNVNIYTSYWGVEGLKCDKLNGSRYMDMPFVVNANAHQIKVIQDGDCVELWSNCHKIEVLETTGHNRDCLTFYSNEGFVFTGDALINGIKVVAKSKYADKEQVIVSINKILARSSLDDVLCPGHNERCKISNCKIVDLDR